MPDDNCVFCGKCSDTRMKAMLIIPKSLQHADVMQYSGGKINACSNCYMCVIIDPTPVCETYKLRDQFDDTLVMVIRQLYKHIFVQNAPPSYAIIADALNKAGIATITGHSWNAQNLRQKLLIMKFDKDNEFLRVQRVKQHSVDVTDFISSAKSNGAGVITPSVEIEPQEPKRGLFQFGDDAQKD